MVGQSIGESYGTEQVIRHSGEGLRHLGHEVYFLAEKQNGPLPNLNGVEFIKLFGNSLTPRHQIRKISAQIELLLRRIRPDIVHLMDEVHPHFHRQFLKNHPVILTSHTVSTTSPSSCRLIRGNEVCEKKSGWSCLVHHWSYGCLAYLKNDLRRLHAVYEYQIRRYQHQRGHAFIGPSRYICHLLERDGWAADRIHRVVNPIVVESPHNSFQGQLPENLIVSASRLIPMKGIDRMVEALYRIKGKKWTAWICGTGPEKHPLEKKVRELQLEDRVVFKGLVPQSELHAILPGATLYCQPNLAPESFGMAAAEAMFHGVPVVGFDVPGLNETVIHNLTGLLAKRGNTEELGRFMMRLLDEPQLRTRLGNAGRVHIRDNFSLNHHLEGLMRVYNSVLKARILT